MSNYVFFLHLLHRFVDKLPIIQMKELGIYLKANFNNKTILLKRANPEDRGFFTNSLVFIVSRLR